MKDPLTQMQMNAEDALGVARELALLRAFAKSQGVVTVPVPDEKTREATGKDKELVAKRRKAVSELIWLHHERDAVCVETGLTPEQVAGILAHQTRSNTSAITPRSPSVARPRATTIGITADPSTWPKRQVERGGSRDNPPEKAKAAKCDDLDTQIVCAVARACGNDKAMWNTLRKQIACARRLWPHSIAGIVARARQLGQLPKLAA